jgi:hypothetical protein
MHGEYMWNNKKSLQVLRYYSIVSIIMCLFFIMKANEYFPPLTLVVNPTIEYLEQQKSTVSAKDKKEELSNLIIHQKILLKNDKYTSDIKFNIMLLSALFIFISILLYIVCTRQLKQNANKT